MIKNITKKFNLNLFNENDKISKIKVIEYFQNEGIELIENPDQYGIDLLNIEDNIIKMGFEVEHRFNWSGYIFPYTTINVPYRKTKFLSDNYKTYYCALNKELTMLFLLDMDKLKSCNIKENKNKYINNGEMFYSVPINLGEFIHI